MSDIFEKCKNYKDAKLAMRLGIYGYFQPIESAQGPEVVLGGKKYIMAGSNNYLGLADDPEMKNSRRRSRFKIRYRMCRLPLFKRQHQSRRCLGSANC